MEIDLTGDDDDCVSYESKRSQETSSYDVDKDDAAKEQEQRDQIMEAQDNTSNISEEVDDLADLAGVKRKFHAAATTEPHSSNKLIAESVLSKL